MLTVLKPGAEAWLPFLPIAQCCLWVYEDNSEFADTDIDILVPLLELCICAHMGIQSPISS